MIRSSLLAIPGHPMAFAIGLVAMFWVDAAISPFAGLRSLVVAVAVVATTQASLTLILRDATRAALLTTALIAVLASKVVLLVVADALSSMTMPIAVIWFALVGAALVMIVRIARRRGPSWTAVGTTRALNVLSVSLLIVATVTAVGAGRVDMLVRDLQGPPPAADGTQAPADLPDIYIVLLDGYPRADVLRELFGYDNSGFLAALEERGFDTATRSRSDYLWTHMTLISMLHRDYLERVEALAALRDGGPIHPTVRRVINDNPTFDDLRGAGYLIHTNAVPIERYAMRGAGYLIDGGQLNEFEISLFRSTFVGDAVDLIAPGFAAEQHRRRIQHDLQAIENLATERSDVPRFVLAHLLSPHHPVVWAADGSPVNPPLVGDFYGDTLIEQGTSRGVFIDRYVGQLEHLNGMVLQTVDAVIQNEARPSVVIIMSDHGSGIGMDPDQPDGGDLFGRTANLFVARTPGRKGVFPDDVTPVDVFRLLLDEYLGTDFGRVPPLPGGLHIEPSELSGLSGLP